MAIFHDIFLKLLEKKGTWMIISLPQSKKNYLPIVFPEHDPSSQIDHT